MFLKQIFEPYLAQYAYLVGCQKTGEAILIDPLRDIDQYRELAEANDLKITAVAETHIHADFVSGACEFAQDPALVLYLSAEGGEDWTYQWTEGRDSVHFLKDEDVFQIGNICLQAIHTPGHTPEHLSFLITDEGGGADQPMALITGDFLFVGDVGRPDLLESAAGKVGVMEPSARQLQVSLSTKLKSFADYVQVLPAHGAGSACGKSLGAVPMSTLGYERRFNAPFKQAHSDAAAFVQDILSGQPEPPLYFATMKRVNRDGIQVTAGVPKVPMLDVSEFQRLSKSCEVIDCSTDAESFDAGHFPDSLYAPLRSAFFTAGIGSFLEETTHCVLIVENAADAELALRQLYRIGLDGTRGWIRADDLKQAGLMEAKVERLDFADFDSNEAQKHGSILDVRTSKEFQEGHIEGAISVPYTRVRQKLDEIPADRKWFIHCGSGKRAALAAAFLARHGREVVHVDGVCEECEKIASEQGVNH